MNSMERIQATIQGTKRDRCAVSLTLSLFGARLIQCPLKKYYTDANAYAQGQAAVRELCNPDILFGPFALPLEGAAFGSEILFFEKNPPNLKQPILESIDTISQLKLPDLDAHPTMLYFFEAVRKMKKLHGNEIPIAGVTFSPVDLPIMLFGIHGWLDVTLFHENEARQLIELLMPYCIRKINRFFESGAAVVVLPCVFANPTILTREIIVKFILPALKDTFQEIKGPLIIHSAGAPLMPFLDLYANLPQVAGFVLNSGEDVDLARQTVDSEMVLIGNVEGPTLLKRSVEDVSQECQHILKTFGEDPHFVLGTAGADIAYDTPIENIRMFSQVTTSLAKGE